MVTFYKYEGVGNDFIMIDNLSGELAFGKDYIKSICDRYFGIGADGVILLESSLNPNANCFMNYYNSDGTVAQMCGNGARCTAKFFANITNSKLKELNIDTRAGVKNVVINEDGTFSVNMGEPVLLSLDFPSLPTKIEGFDFKFVSMGNPHAVTIVENLEDIEIKEIGPKVENNDHFPNKVNVEFVEKIDDLNYKVKVWERGCGETLACGTGACAVFATIHLMQDKSLEDEEITLQFPGGNLYLSQNHNNKIILRGEAHFVFKGEIE
jgi:diaminopimelate epimerase